MIRFTRYFIVLTICLGLSNPGQSQNKNLLRAAFLLDQERYEDVLVLIDQIAYSKQEAIVYFDILGETAFQAGDYDKALSAYKKRCELKNPAMSHYMLSKIYFLSNNSSLGYKSIRDHLASDHRISLQHILADEAFDSQVRDREWIRFWSEDWYTEKDDLIAEAWAQLNEDDPDISVFDQLMLSFSNEPQSSYLSGRFNELAGNPRQAIDHFRKAIDLAPESTEYINYLAAYYAGLKKYSESSALISSSLKINLYQPSLWMLRISNHLNMDDNQGAMSEMQYLEEIGIESPDLWTALAIQVKKTDIRLAISFIDRVVDNDPLSITALNFRAGLYWDNQDYDSAMSDWAMSLDVDPIQAKVYFARGEARYHLGDFDGACHDWKKALRYGHRKALDRLYKYCE
ncbi:MAG: tetratricopeptide repeat protein [Bacteroidota bacterium]|nr:tetratricopeptide repeat protein [Bacteroidota bacterium]